MSIYVSKHANLQVQVRSPRVTITPTGEAVQTVSRLSVQFQRGSAGDDAVRQATERMDFGALPQGVRVGFRTGVFDTEVAQREYGWTDDDRKTVEEFLDRNQGNEAGWIKYERAPLAPPWPAIDKLRPHGRRTGEGSFEKLVEAADMFGVDLAEVEAYVRQEEWPQNVADLLREYIARQASAEPTEELVEA